MRIVKNKHETSEYDVYRSSVYCGWISRCSGKEYRFFPSAESAHTTFSMEDLRQIVNKLKTLNK